MFNEKSKLNQNSSIINIILNYLFKKAILGRQRAYEQMALEIGRDRAPSTGGW